MRPPLLLAVLLVLAGPALANDRAATPAEIAKASAVADEVIARAGAADLFENITDNATATVRHSLSGLVCHFEPGARGGVIVFTTSGDYPRGDDVGCTTLLDGVQVTLFANRDPKVSPELDRKAMVTALGRRYSNVSDYTGPEMAEPVRPTSKRYRSRLLAERDGKPLYIEVITTKRGQWCYKLLMITGREDIPFAQQVADSTMDHLINAAIARPGTN